PRRRRRVHAPRPGGPRPGRGPAGAPAAHRTPAATAPSPSPRLGVSCPLVAPGRARLTPSQTGISRAPRQPPGGGPQPFAPGHRATRVGEVENYLRYPHLHADLVTFVAADDVWIAPVGGGRAWRLTHDSAPAAFPRFSP